MSDNDSETRVIGVLAIGMIALTWVMMAAFVVDRNASQDDRLDAVEQRSEALEHCARFWDGDEHAFAACLETQGAE